MPWSQPTPIFTLGQLIRSLYPLMKRRTGRNIIFTPPLMTPDLVTHTNAFMKWSDLKESVSIELHENKLFLVGRGVAEFTFDKFDLENELTQEYVADEIMRLLH